MSRFLKFRKWFILIMVVLAVATAATAFSVSYAKWTSSGTQISADGKTGTWAELNAGYTIEFDDGTSKAFIRNEVSGKYTVLFAVSKNKVPGFNIVGKTTGFIDNINVITSNGVTKPCITDGDQNGDQNYKYKPTDAGEYEIIIDAKVKTISFIYYAPEYSYIIQFSDGTSRVFNTDGAKNPTHTITFSIGTDKNNNAADLSFKILVNQEDAIFTDANTTISESCVTTTEVAGFTYKTTGIGMYTVVIKDGKISFTCAKAETVDQSFIKAVKAAGPMETAIGSKYGILTSNGNIILFNTAEGRSNYFTLKENRYFAMMIGKRVNRSSFYTKTNQQLLIPTEGIKPNPQVGSGDNSHLFLVEKEGTYYVTYRVNEAGAVIDIRIKNIDRIDFENSIDTVIDGSCYINKSSSTLTMSADGSYTTEFEIKDTSNRNFNVYLNDVKTELEIAEESKQYVTKNESGDYAFTFKSTGTFNVSVTDNILTVTSDNAEIINTVASVTVSGETSVTEGQTINLSATVMGELGTEITDKKVTWKVDDSAIATINENGALKGVKAGTVNVTASVDGVTSEAFAVTVVKEKVASVAVSGANTVEEGKTITLTAIVTGEFNTVLTDRTVEWSVDNGSASVSPSGVLTGISAGTVKVTATADGVASAEFTVTVIEKEKVASIQIVGAATVEVGKSITLTVTATGTYGTVWTDYKPVTWSVNDSSLATVGEATGVLEGVTEGTVTVTATVEGVAPVEYTVTVTEYTAPSITKDSLVFAKDTESATKYATVPANSIIGSTTLFTATANSEFNYTTSTANRGSVTYLEDSSSTNMASSSLASAITKGGSAEILTVKAETKIQVRIYLALSTANWGDNITGTVTYKIKQSDGTYKDITSNTSSFAGRNVTTVTVDLDAGEELELTISNSTTKNCYVYLGGIEATTPDYVSSKN